MKKIILLSLLSLVIFTAKAQDSISFKQFLGNTKIDSTYLYQVSDTSAVSIIYLDQVFGTQGTFLKYSSGILIKQGYVTKQGALMSAQNYYFIKEGEEYKKIEQEKIWDIKQ